MSDLRARAEQLWRDLTESMQPCPSCGGAGWTVGIRAEHDPRCDGTCSVGCPIPVQTQEQCPCDGRFVIDQDLIHAALLQVERETIERCIAECGKVRNLQAGLCIERLRALLPKEESQ